MALAPEELEEFKNEASELLEMAEKSLLALENNADFDESFDSLFRGLHSFKSACGMMELFELQEFAHEFETLLVNFKSTGSIPKPYLNMFLKAVDAARVMFDGGTVEFSFKPEAETAAKQEKVVELQVAPTEKTETSPKAKAYEVSETARNEFVTECDEIVERISKNLHILEKSKYTREHIDELYRDVHSLKGAAYLFSFTRLGDVAHAMESSLERIREGIRVPSQELVNSLFKCIQLIEALVQRIRTQAGDDDLVMKILATVNLLNQAAEKLTVADARPDESVAAEKKDTEASSSIRVPITLLDNLMTLIGEMVLVRNQVLQYSNKTEDLEFLSMSKRLNVVTSEIQGEMMKTRMQPIGNILNKFNRLVRDLSQELGKPLSLQIIGAETELDKSLLESIKDPLTHIIRNSCDHGIETAAVRKSSAKAPVGTIVVKAYHEGGQVVIEVSDDGKGLQKELIVKKAIEKGLLLEAQAKRLDDKEIFNLIFSPGFSTAAQVTNVSGRGVGMDVVRTNIERLGGNVELSSTPQVGTTIKIKIPLTLAIVPALIVKSGEDSFAIPQAKLEELVCVDPSSEENYIDILHGAPVYRLRGSILPLVDLAKVLRPDGSLERNYSNSIINIAVVSAEKCSFGLIIDEVRDTADIVVKPLNRLLKSLQVYSGATVLGDGSITLILDVLGLSKVAKITSLNHDASQDELKKNKNKDLQEFLLVKLAASAKHALELSFVHRLEEFRVQDIEYSGKQRMIRYRDVILPLISANEILGYSKNENDNHVIHVVVVQRAGKVYGIEVDEILDIMSTETVVSRSFHEQIGLYGNLNTPDELIVVIDPFAIIGNLTQTNGLAPVKELTTDLGKTILCAEDSVFFQNAIREILEKDGHRVIMVKNGQEALEYLTNEAPALDLIISDIEMPKMNGFELASAVRKNAKYGQLPMVALSSRADDEYKKRGKQMGFDVYLEKLNPQELKAVIVDLVRAQRRVA